MANLSKFEIIESRVNLDNNAPSWVELLEEHLAEVRHNSAESLRLFKMACEVNDPRHRTLLIKEALKSL